MGLFRRKQKSIPFGMGTGIIRGSGIVGELPRLGTRQLIEGYNLFPWLRMVVDKIADVVGNAEWTVSVKDKKTGDMVGLLDHPLLTLLKSGNGAFSGLHVRKLSIKHYLLTGEFMWMLERNAFGMPVALWPIPPHWAVYAPTFNNDPKAVYRMQFRLWHAEIPATEIVHVYEPNPSMPYGRGSGRGMTLSDELETDEYAARFSKAFFYNSARPDLVISAADADNPFTKEVAGDLERTWMNKAQGWARAWRAYFVHGSTIKIDKISNEYSGADMMTLRKGLRDAVMQMFNLPPETLGILDNSNRSTIGEAAFFLQKFCAEPRLIDIREALQHRLVPEFDKKLVLGFVSPVQVDKEQRIEIMTSNPAPFEWDEVREAAGLAPLPDGKGKVHSVPVNMIVTTVEDALTASRQLLNPDAPLPSAEKPNPEDEDNNPDNGTKKLSIRKDLTDDQKRKILFLLSLLENHANLLLGQPWVLMRAALAETIQVIGDAEFLYANAPDDKKFMLTAALAAFISTWLATRAAEIDATTGAQLAAKLRSLINDGASLDDLVQAATDYMATMGGRLDAIAATENGVAASKAQEAAFVQLGSPGKEWLSQRDEKVRDTHAELDGTVVPLSAKFHSSSGASAPSPRQFGVPEEDINCRCFLLPSSIAGDSNKNQRWQSLNNVMDGQEAMVRNVVKRVANRQAMVLVAALRRK